MYTELEARVLTPGKMQGTALRYGFFYGPHTWYHPEGATAQQVREGRFPIVGTGKAVWSFVHIEDAAAATVAALTAAPGVYNVVDDDPLPIRQWLPRYAEWLKAPPVPFISEEAARANRGRGYRLLRDETPRRIQCEGEARAELRAPCSGMDD